MEIGERMDLVLCGHVNLLPVACLVARVKHAPLWCGIYGTDEWQPNKKQECIGQSLDPPSDRLRVHQRLDPPTLLRVVRGTAGAYLPGSQRL